MLRSHLVDRTIQKPSRRLRVSRSNLRWGHPALRPAANAHPEDRERERRARRRRGGREGTGEKRERDREQMQRHKLLLVVNFICEVVDQNVI